MIPAMAAVERPELACPPWSSAAVDVAGGVVVVAVAVPLIVSLVVPLAVVEAVVPLVVVVALALVALVLLEVRVLVADLVEDVDVVAPFAASMKSSSVTVMGVFEVSHASLIVR